MGRLLAISDIHGCHDTFLKLVTGKLRLKKSDSLILLGDYIDRGDKSREVIDLILDLVSSGYDITPLAGNHEWMLTGSLLSAEMQSLWFMNSGVTTLDSFRISEISELEKRYSDFFKNLKYYEIRGGYLFVHAGFNDSAPDPFSDIEGMIWESHSTYTNKLLAGRTIIHGHRPKTIEFVEKILAARGGVIPIDTGCVYDKSLGYGNLSALDVTSMKLISIERL